jgi:hypothetical protein
MNLCSPDVKYINDTWHPLAGVQSYKWKWWGSLAHSSRLKEMSMNHDMRPLSLHTVNFTLIKAQLNDNLQRSKQTNHIS